MDFSFQSIIQKHSVEMDFAFRSLVDTIVHHSKLSISLLRISNVTENSFHVSLEAHISKTGPVSTSITSMTVELHGPAGQFGKITLPAITTQAHGTDVVVTSQIVDIVDEKALIAFIREVLERSSTFLCLRNGKTSITAMGVAPREVTYEKEICLPGMDGPVISVHSACVIQNPSQLSSTPSSATVISSLGRSQTAASVSSMSGPGGASSVSIIFHVLNPSPLEISFGTCVFEIVDHHGKLVVEAKGRLDIRRSHFEITVQGNVNRPVATRLAAEIKEAADKHGSKKSEIDEKPSPGARLVGRRCAGAGWCDETVKVIDVPIHNIRRLLQALEMDVGPAEPEENKSAASFAKWTQRWMMR